MSNFELIPGRGTLITFEGGDGSGKGTQTQELFEYLLSLDLPVRKGGFPMYETPTGQEISAYLNDPTAPFIDPDVAGLLYQRDRLANIGPIIEWLERGGIALLDRYIDSNSGHQGGKIPDRDGRMAYIRRNVHTELVENGLPEPDLTILFTLAPELARAYVAMKKARTYTDKTHDAHEDDPNHLANANEAFLLLPEMYPHRFRHINTTAENGLEMLPRKEITHEVIKAVRPLLIAKGYDLPV